jgi:hypothetical protein
MSVNDQRRGWGRRWAQATMGALLSLTVGSSVAAAQSLGEVARREAARRKAIKAPARVFTNDDLGRSLPTPPAAAAPAQQLEAGKPAPPPANAGGEVTDVKDVAKDQKYWRDRIEGARSDLSRNQLLLDALQSRVNALSTDFVNRDDPAQRALVAEDRQKALAELERTRQEIERLRKLIADIEEEARKTGVPPGWLR